MMVRYPNTKDIVNVPSIKEEFIFKVVGKGVFVDHEEHGGPGGGWWGSHGSSKDLVPEGIPEGENVVKHDDGERINKRFHGDCWELSSMLPKVSCNQE